MPYHYSIARTGGRAAMVGLIFLLSACGKVEPAGNQTDGKPSFTAPVTASLSPQDLALRGMACDVTLRSANNPAVTGRLPADLAKGVQEARTFELMAIIRYARDTGLPMDKTSAAHREGKLGPVPSEPITDDYVVLLRDCVAANAQLAKLIP